MLNQLHSNIVWTQRANFIDIPTDCPQRDERLGWTGDAQVYIGTAALNCDVQAFFNKWLVDLTDGQRGDGQFPMVAPVKVAGDDGGPAWADAGVICPGRFTRFTATGGSWSGSIPRWSSSSSSAANGARPPCCRPSSSTASATG